MDRPRMVGPTIMVPVGDNAVMTAPNPDADPHVEWSLRYSTNLNDPRAGRFSAAAVVESYAYLLSTQINMTEATRRLRVLRTAVRDRRFWVRAQPATPSAGSGDAQQHDHRNVAADESHAGVELVVENGAVWMRRATPTGVRSFQLACDGCSSQSDLQFFAERVSAGLGITLAASAAPQERKHG